MTFYGAKWQEMNTLVFDEEIALWRPHFRGQHGKDDKTGNGIINCQEILVLVLYL